MMWVFFGLVVIETAIVHLLVALWSPGAALLLSVFGVSALIWLILFIRSLSSRPVWIGEGRLIWPCGMLRTVVVPLDQVAGIRADWDGILVKARDTFNGALIAYPNIMVDLRAPVHIGRREIARLAHKLDDAEAFAAALAGLVRKA